jgi:hypothetical protein
MPTRMPTWQGTCTEPESTLSCAREMGKGTAALQKNATNPLAKAPNHAKIRANAMVSVVFLLTTLISPVQ